MKCCNNRAGEHLFMIICHVLCPVLEETNERGLELAGAPGAESRPSQAEWERQELNGRFCCSLPILNSDAPFFAISLSES